MARFARLATQAAGSTTAMALAFAFVLGWLVGGFLRADGFSSEYQLWLNSPTTAVTFLTVFLIQRAQNADTKALHVKLDELVRALEGARNEVAGIETADEDAIDRVRQR